MSGSKPKTTAGEALFELDRPIEDYPKRKPWSAMDDREHDRYEHRAADILETADKIRAGMKDQIP